MGKKMRILAALGLAMIVTGLTTILWGGLVLENNLLGFIGGIIGLGGFVILTKRF